MDLFIACSMLSAIKVLVCTPAIIKFCKNSYQPSWDGITQQLEQWLTIPATLGTAQHCAVASFVLLAERVKVPICRGGVGIVLLAGQHHRKATFRKWCKRDYEKPRGLTCRGSVTVPFRANRNLNLHLLPWWPWVLQIRFPVHLGTLVRCQYSTLQHVELLVPRWIADKALLHTWDLKTIFMGVGISTCKYV
jgi:hypothetical protein